MDIPWDDTRLFLAIAETGSLSAAARQLLLGQPTVSRRLADLEYRLGYPLFRRSASGATPTAAGARLLEPARRMAEWAGEVGRAAAAGDRAPQGTVRIAAPPGVAFDFVAPFAAWVQARLPGIQLEVLSKIEYLDLARGEADLALRFRAPPPGSDLVTVASYVHDVTVCVAKSYAQRLPKQVRPADLRWIAWSAAFDDVPPNPQLRELIPGFRPHFTSDNYLVMVAAAEAGVGAIVLGNAAHRFSLPSRLVRLPLPLGAYARSALHLVCARSALDVPRVRAVKDLLVAEIERMAPKR
jgi:DNA-binding transcriptional LysR family regulator